MKKLLSIVLLSLFSLTAHAWELCPPSTAFWHMNGKDTAWTLDPSYVQRGWFIEEDQAAASDLKFLPVDGALFVHALPRDKNHVEYILCIYYFTKERSKQFIAVKNEKMSSANLDNFFSSMTYYPRVSCRTTNSMAGKCAW